MLGLFALLGVGIAMAAIAGGGDEAPAEETTAEAEAPEIPQEKLSDDPQFVAPASDRGNLLSLFNAIAAESDRFSSEQAAAIVEGATLIDGPMNVDTSGGDDVVFGSASNDVIVAGAGDDMVLGGAGDDQVRLGDGNDTYGLETPGSEGGAELTAPQNMPQQLADYIAVLQTSDAGNDSVWGGKGNDVLRDGRGINRLAGNEGNDLINVVDIDEVTPDMAVGGWGNDHLIVDQGDVAWGGQGADLIEMVFPKRLEAGFKPIKIADFERGVDRIELNGVAASLSHVDKAALPETLYKIEDLADGSGSMILVNGIPVVHVVGGQGLKVSDLIIT